MVRRGTNPNEPGRLGAEGRRGRNLARLEGRLVGRLGEPHLSAEGVPRSAADPETANLKVVSLPRPGQRLNASFGAFGHREIRPWVPW